MNGLLITPVSQIAQKKKILLELKDMLAQAGHTLDTEVLTISESELAKMSDHQEVVLYNTAIKRIREADFVVAEVTNPSSSIGYLISKAVAERKPVLVLMEQNDNRVPLAFKVKSSKLINFYRYSSVQTIKHIAQRFSNQLKDMVDSKFILIISPEIDRYLDWVAGQRRKHKSQVVREALKQAIAGDEEYKEFLSEETAYLRS